MNRSRREEIRWTVLNWVYYDVMCNHVFSHALVGWAPPLGAEDTRESMVAQIREETR